MIELSADLVLRNKRFAGAILRRGTYLYCGSANGSGWHCGPCQTSLPDGEKNSIGMSMNLTNGTGHVVAMLVMPDGCECDLRAALGMVPGISIPIAGFWQFGLRALPCTSAGGGKPCRCDDGNRAGPKGFHLVLAVACHIVNQRTEARCNNLRADPAHKGIAQPDTGLAADFGETHAFAGIVAGPSVLRAVGRPASRQARL